MAIATVNPATGKTEMIIEPHTPEEVEERIAEAAEAARLCAADELRAARRSGCSPRRTSSTIRRTAWASSSPSRWASRLRSRSPRCTSAPRPCASMPRTPRNSSPMPR